MTEINDPICTSCKVSGKQAMEAASKMSLEPEIAPLWRGLGQLRQAVARLYDELDLS